MQKKHIGTLVGLLLAGGILTSSAQDDSLIIKNRTASSYDNSIGRIYTGKAPFNRTWERVEEPKAAPAKPAPRPQVSEACAYLVGLSKKAPSLVSVGDEFTYELNVVGLCDVAETVVQDTLPAGATYVSSDPSATKDGDKLTWKLGNMSRGEAKTIKVTVKAEKEGELVNCATVSAIPRVCVSTMVGKAQLAITKTGPAVAQLGQAVTYTITVQNTGNTIAKNVVVTDPAVEGLTSTTGQGEVTINVGDLAPGASKVIPVTFKADKRGKVCNKALAASSNAGKVDATACTTIVQAGLKIEKTTKDKELLINRTASYDIVVSNTGDTDLTGVVVTDTAAAGTTIVSADGGTVTGNTASWNLGTLAAGAKKNLTVKVLSRTPGKFCDIASVTSVEGLKDSAQDCSNWRGVSGVLIEMVDDPDPIQVGEITTFTLRVTNQGLTSDIENVNIKANFTDLMDATTASGGGTISGKSVTFPTVPRIAPKQAVTYTIIGKALKAGDHRMQIDVTTKDREKPITKDESTTIY